MAKCKKGFFIPVFFVFLLAFFFAGCKEDDKVVYKIVFLLPLGSHELANLANDMRYIAGEFYKKKVKDNPVLKEKGVSVEFEYIDTMADAALTVDRMRAFIIHNPDILAFMGPVLSRTAIPAGSIAQQVGIPMISSMATHPSVTKNRGYVFAMLPDNLLQVRALVRFVRENLGVHNAAVVYDPKDDYSRDMADYFKRIFPATGGKISGFFADSVLDSNVVSSIKSQGVEVVFAPLFGNNLLSVYNILKNSGFGGTMIGGDSWDSVDESVSNVVDGYFSFFWDGAFYESESADFFINLSETKPELKNGFYNTVFCDSLFFLLEGLENMDIPSPKNLRDVLSSYIGGNIRKFAGILGDYRMDKVGKITGKIYIYKRMGGKDQLVVEIDPLE
ncbi:ABC transporter substrate-binding protein [Spirochaetia bacterium 38H-sp]|uniref:ABC transporter substrate-binding protein n=1 Tax=Rarispira pelagica TaxID=3141764 RepID=A0ABU9U9I0_9SPIR